VIAIPTLDGFFDFRDAKWGDREEILASFPHSAFFEM